MKLKKFTAKILDSMGASIYGQDQFYLIDLDRFVFAADKGECRLILIYDGDGTQEFWVAETLDEIERAINGDKQELNTDLKPGTHCRIIAGSHYGENCKIVSLSSNGYYYAEILTGDYGGYSFQIQPKHLEPE